LSGNISTIFGRPAAGAEDSCGEAQAIGEAEIESIAAIAAKIAAGLPLLNCLNIFSTPVPKACGIAGDAAIEFALHTLHYRKTAANN
jgi:hypothetical protein